MSPSSLPASTRPAVVLHVGMGKTGTSSIQAWFHRNRQRLTRHGVLFPQSPGKRRHARLSLAVQVDEARRPPDRRGIEEPPASQLRPVVREELVAEIRASKPSRLLLSDEGLCGASDEAIENLRHLLDGVAESVRVVFYLRRQDEHLCSRYQQVVKWNGLTARLAERADRMGRAAGLYDYRARLEAWQRVFRPDELVVRRFERADFVGGTLLRDFLDAAGLALHPEDFEEGPTRNTSLDAESVELLRLLNILEQAQGGEVSGMPPWKQTLRTLHRVSEGPTLALPEEQMDRFMSRWEATNRAVAREHFPRGPEALFGARSSRSTTAEQRLDPSRLPHFFELLQIPPRWHDPLRTVAEHEAAHP